MTTSAEPRRTHPRDWSVRTKAAVIVAVPLLVLITMGGGQIAVEIQRASRSEQLAEQISTLPAIMRYATSVGATVGVAEFGLSLDENNAVFDDYTATVEALAKRADLDPTVSDGINRILLDGRELARAAATRSTSMSTRIEQMRVFGMQVQHTVRALIDQSENASALTESERLLDLWQVRLAPFDQAVAFTRSVADSDVAQQLLETAFATERALLSGLQGTYEDQQALTELQTAAQHRHMLLLSPTTSTTRTPDLTESLLSSVEIGDRLMEASIDRIITELDAQRNAARDTAIRTAVLIAIAIAGAVAITFSLTRLIVSSLHRLRDGTIRAANYDLPAAVAAIRSDTDPNTVTIAPIGINTAEEIGQVARAVDGVNSQALFLAAEQAALRRQITTMLDTLAGRNRSLVDQQLVLIEMLEFKERDPGRLQSLFELDHLAARMRRIGDSLLVLAGTRSRRTSRGATLLEDVLRAAVSQVESYQQVRLGAVPPVTIAGNTVDDLIHLFTELLDNSLQASGPNNSVALIVSPAVEHGLLIEIVDRGPGISAPELNRINYRLAEGMEIDAQATRHMGLYVVGRIARRHRLQVRLRPTANDDAARGITASVYLPSPLITEPDAQILSSTTQRPRGLLDSDTVGSYAPRSS